jgi:hypothetical protein
LKEEGASQQRIVMIEPAIAIAVRPGLPQYEQEKKKKEYEREKRKNKLEDEARKMYEKEKREDQKKEEEEQERVVGPVEGEGDSSNQTKVVE